jgi:uncharacterized protein (UPF0333 family)
VIDIKAQYSMEFILVFAFSLLIILPVITLLHSEYSDSKQSLDQAQGRSILEDIAISAQETYYAGYPSRMTLTLFFPEGITNITYKVVDVSGITKSEFNMKILNNGIENELVEVLL